MMTNHPRKFHAIWSSSFWEKLVTYIVVSALAWNSLGREIESCRGFENCFPLNTLWSGYCRYAGVVMGVWGNLVNTKCGVRTETYVPLPLHTYKPLSRAHTFANATSVTISEDRELESEHFGVGFIWIGRKLSALWQKYVFDLFVTWALTFDLIAPKI